MVNKEDLERGTFVASNVREAFVHFSRNGRWGTCGFCPRDVDGHAYPEFCQYRDRGDHMLALSGLTEQHERYVKRVQSGEIRHSS